ncbi:MAG: S-layer homology domain-containing protein, partial [Clostridiaceae bacterium]|nr:S-layer homology domain-containing protein [Clostridiaceae bacterium]
MDVKIRRSLGILTVLVFLLANVVIVSAEVPDIKSHWAEEVVTSWIGQGLISGYEDGSFKPNDPVKRAEFVAFSNRVLKLLDKSESAFNDVSANAWYSEDVLKAVEADMIKGYGDGIFKPEAPITRQEAAVVLFNAFELAVDESNSANSFADSGKIASWAKSAVSSLYKEGYVKGRTGNNFAPTDNITRAETVAMINNIMGTLIKSGGEFTNSVKGNLVVNTANVVLKGMEIEGDLYLTQGIGEGEIVLDNVIVKGRTVVKGGGSDSIVFKNTKLGKDLLVNKKGANKVRIVAQGGTEIPKVSLKSPAKLLESELTGKGFEIVNIAVVKNVKATGNVELDGDFTDVSVDTEDSKVDVIKGTISNINIQAKAEVSISGGTINAIKVAPQAAAAIVSIAKVAIVKLLDVAAKADIRIAGKLESITVQKEAADATINVDEGAQVLAITIEAKITITGKGVITTATINVSGVVIETKPANVTLGQNVTSTIGEETVTGDTSSSTGGGGGGGGDD